MLKKIFVGNLPFSAKEEELKDLFSQHGQVQSVKLVTDRETGRSRGFAFVEMDGAEADAAMAALDGVDLGGRNLRVNEAHERGARPGGGMGGDRGGGGDRAPRGDRPSEGGFNRDRMGGGGRPSGGGGGGGGEFRSRDRDSGRGGDRDFERDYGDRGDRKSKRSW